MADFEASSVIINDFTGGMTDFFFDGNKEEYQKAENFLLTPDKKLSTRPGSRIDADGIYILPSGNRRVGAMFSYDDDNVMFIQSDRNIYARTTTSTALQTIANPNPALGLNELSNFVAYAFWNHHTFVTSDSLTKPVKLFKTGTNYIVRTAGLPKPTTPTAIGTAGANNYLYAVTFSVAYTIDAPDPITFEDESAPVFLAVENVNAPNVNPVNFTNLQAIVNGSVNNYDTANIKVRIYRAENNQTTYYFVGQVNNGTTVFSDTMSDAALINSTELYTNGGVPANDEPPQAKIVHILNDTAYYAGIVENGELLATRIRQSIPANPDAVPEGFFTDVQQDITGVSSYAGNLIVFTANKIYRASGQYDELGNGGIFFDEISETIGSVNHLGIVQTKMGVFFPGIDGFYMTDGYSVRRVSEKLINTYKTATTNATQRSRIYGTYDKENNRVYWSLMSNTGAVDNDILFVLDLRFGVRDNSSFTTWTGTLGSFYPTAICMFDRIFRRGDRQGYLFKHTSDILTDPAIDTANIPGVWLQDTIIYDYRSTAMNFGMPNIRKWVSKILLSLRNVSNVSLQVYSINDDSNDMQTLVEVRDVSQPVWGDSTMVWGDAECIWNFFPLVETFRRFPKNKLRCSYKQIRFTNALTIVSESDTLGVAAVVAVANTATLAGTNEWPANCIGYFLSFENDNYTNQYEITGQTDTVLTFADPDNTSPIDGSYKWLLKGYAKNETLSLLGYIIYFAPISKSFTPFSGNLGENR